MIMFNHIPAGSKARYVRSLPVPNHIKTYVARKFDLWAACSGEEWAVSRFKDLKGCILKSYADGERIKPQWFRTTAAGNLKGPFGSLFNFALIGGDNLKAVMYLLNIYTSVSRHRMKPVLFKEISETIRQSPPKGIQGWLENSRSKIITIVKDLNLYGSLRSKEPIGLALVSPGKLGHFEKVSEDVSHILGHPLYEKYGDFLDIAIGARGLHCTEKYPGMPLVGQVNVTHEPGLKARYFAAPNQVLQRALEPLKDALLSKLPSLPWDCTFDHRKADHVIQERLRMGGIVHSVDMTSATDNFPWLFQRMVLHLISSDNEMTRNAVNLFTDIIGQGTWEFSTPEGYQPSVIWWGKGQPLGLGPSFPLFAMSHGILLYLLNNGVWEDDFYILGDDVIILSDELHEQYRKVLQTFEVPVSQMKSFSSAKLAQFGGVTLTSDVLFWQPKWRKPVYESMLDVAAWWYPSLELPKYSDLINRVLALPPPWGQNRENGDSNKSEFDEYFVQVILEAEDRKQEKPSPAQTRPSFERLLSGQISKWHTLHPVLNEPPFRLGPHHISPYLMDETEITGYPKIRRKPGNRDPYSLGTLDFWSRILKRAETLRTKAQTEIV